MKRCPLNMQIAACHLWLCQCMQDVLSLLMVEWWIRTGNLLHTFSCEASAQCDNICPEVLLPVFKIVQGSVLDLSKWETIVIKV